MVVGLLPERGRPGLRDGRASGYPAGRRDDIWPGAATLILTFPDS
jgi:hypothetical protein